MEKLILALVFAAKRLRRTILADFLIEKPETDIVLPQSEVKLPEPWILFTDGSSCVDGSGAGLILTNPEGMEFTYALRLNFNKPRKTEAGLRSLLAGLRIAARMGVVTEAKWELRLVANHGCDRFTFDKFLGVTTKSGCLKVRSLTQACALQKQVLVEILKNKSISEMEISTVIEEQDPTWMTPIVDIHKTNGHAPTMTKGMPGAYAVYPQEIRTATRESSIDVRSYRHGSGASDIFGRTFVLARSLRVHAVALRTTFVGGMSLRSGLLWPYHARDARDMIRKCKDCQVHRPIPRQPQQELNTYFTSHMAFPSRGVVDIAGPLSPLRGED
ncbi:hypothetical protein Tco_1405692 [Tanacetum coccineum]